jgi:hypothetical protein
MPSPAITRNAVQFRVCVARLVIRRERNSTAEYDLPAAFVLVTPEEYARRKSGLSEDPLIHTGARRLTGRIHFVTAAASRSVVEEYGQNNGALFERLAADQAGSFPTIMCLKGQFRRCHTIRLESTVKMV